MSKEKPILFSTLMVKAILEGRKTMTRRIIKPQPKNPQCMGINPIWGIGVPIGLKYNPNYKKEFLPNKNDPWNYYGIHCATNVNGKRIDR